MQEMELIIGKSDVKLNFLRQWTQYVPAILAYADKSVRKSLLRRLVDTDHGQFKIICHN